MKKKIAALVLLALCVCLLAGCGCEHEWVEADCITAKFCAKCEATEGEPLGHSWQEATCTAPKTCSGCSMTEGTPLEHHWQEARCEAPRTCTLCAATEGEALGHSFGSWEVSGETMIRRCDTCGTEESAQTDRAVILNDLLLGRWECDAVIMDSFGFDSDPQYVFEHAIPYVVAGENNAMHYCNGTEHFDGTISFYEYIAESDAERYYFIGMQDDVPQLPYLLEISPEGDPVLYAYHTYYTLKLYPESEEAALMREALVGSWTSTKEEIYEESGIRSASCSSYTMTFRDDHAFTGSLDGEEIEGFWLSPDLLTTEDLTRYSYPLMYSKDNRRQWSHAFLTIYHYGTDETSQDFIINFDNVLMVYYEPDSTSETQN